MKFFDIFKRNSSSSAAKNRLKNLLVYDRAFLSPKEMDKMKNEIFAVISQYIKIDRKAAKMEFEENEGSGRVSLIATIPIEAKK